MKNIHKQWAVRHRPTALGGIGLLAMALLSGCANTWVHDEQRDKQAQDTQKLVAEVRTSDTVAALEKTFAEVAALEEQRARDSAAYLFDQELRVMARASSLTAQFDAAATTQDGLKTVVTKRLADLGLTDTSKLADLRRLSASFVARQRALQSTLIEFRGTVGHRFDSCLDVQAASDNGGLSDAFLARIPADRQQRARSKFPALLEDCQKVQATLDERSKLVKASSLFQALYQRQDNVQTESLRYEQALKQARHELEEAAAAHHEAATALAPAAQDKLDTVEARAKRLADAAGRLSKGLTGLGDAGAHALATEKLTHLEAILLAVAGTPPEGSVQLSDKEQVSVALLRDIPALADEADQLFKEAKKPRLVPLMATIDQQKLIVQGYEAHRLSKHKELTAVNSEIEVGLKEVEALGKVLHPLEQHAAWANRSLQQLLDGLPPPEKAQLLRALAIYADEVKQYRIEGKAWTVRAEAARHEAGFVRSKYAAAQWDALIGTIATVLADYHAAGIKRADLAEFFKALGLVAVGVGVAQ
ncbi:MAG: hypothetical protein EOP36_10340 [Rubrivivax sp.]|nr:MAG: hypothetical protein EOP36_10340 [Rubrivivax sp.]